MSGRRVSQLNFFYWGKMDDFSVFKFFFQPFLLFSIIPFKLLYFLDKNLTLVIFNRLTQKGLSMRYCHIPC